VHEGGYRVEWGPTGRLNFYTPRGLPLPDVPPGPRGVTVAALIRDHHTRGVRPDYRTGRTRWAHLDDAPLDVVERATEAVLG
jgi:hypothetical protein